MNFKAKIREGSIKSTKIAPGFVSSVMTREIT